MDPETRAEIALREAKEFYSNQRAILFGSQIAILVIFGAMVYFEVALRWMLIFGVFAVCGTLGGLLNRLGFRLDIGRAYLEIWSRDMENDIDVVRTNLP